MPHRRTDKNHSPITRAEIADLVRDIGALIERQSKRNPMISPAEVPQSFFATIGVIARSHPNQSVVQSAGKLLLNDFEWAGLILRLANRPFSVSDMRELLFNLQVAMAAPGTIYVTLPHWAQKLK